MRKCFAVLLLTLPWIVVSGCGSDESRERVVIQKPGKTITVLANKNDLLVNKAAFSRMSRYPERIGLGWVDENTLLVAVNHAKDGAPVIGQYMIEMNLITGQEESLPSDSLNQVEAELSPDRKSVYYKVTEGINASATGYILNLERRIPVRVTEENAVFVKEGSWTDNGHVVYADLEGSIYKADGTGAIEKQLVPGEEGVKQVFQWNETFYYLKSGGQLTAVQENGSATELSDHVEEVIPSPDKTQAALIKSEASGGSSLVILSMDSRKERTIAKGQSFYSPAWSPDGSKLAFSVISNEIGQGGLFLAHGGATQQLVQLSSDVFTGYPIRFSPSGNQLLATKVIEEQQRNMTVTYVMTFTN
ncbi:PD40 domain-containing protein [Paenibacillus sp. FJAT-26967]|uniref:PD40 domain-containing protein n=1 Tax=Paenibacillus sp. FJAT-26967 TaxID=1729690 RepID=UPI000838F246|nr:PD40 domain-containing protein [Paenibacillus sp. FJAT-26967]